MIVELILVQILQGWDLKEKDDESDAQNDGKTIDSYHSNYDSSFVQTKVGIILPESMINDTSEMGD